MARVRLDAVLSRKNTRTVSLLLALLSAFAVILLYYTQNPFLEAFEAKTYDLRFKTLRGPIPASTDIAIIAIDDKTIAELGRFPFSRRYHTQLLQRLKSVQPKAVLFDVLFPEAEDAQTDRELGRAIRASGNVALGIAFDVTHDHTISGSLCSLPVIAQGAVGTGHLNMTPEDDGVNRRNVLVIEQDGTDYPSLGLRAAMMARGIANITRAPFRIELGEQQIPVTAEGALWINYTGGPGRYPRYSFTDVVHGRIAPELLRDKLLFVGATALGIYDMRVTPYHNNVPGVEIHAAVADDILSERYIQRTGLERLSDLLFILLLASSAYLLTTRLQLPRAIAATLLLSVGYLGLSHYLFLQGHWISMVYPPLAALTALLVGGGFRYLVLERDAREMREMFSSYLSPKLVSQLEKDPAAARIGGDNKEVTLLFTDIRSFTSFSESHTPQEVVARLNEYLASMTRVIYQYDGTVDKFIGDGIMAYWGAPIAQPEHARLAIECALAMRKEMAVLTAQWQQRGVPAFVIRGGIQSGEVVAGNIGMHGRKMEYTVIGDTVNQASRLEGTAKYYGVQFLVGEVTYQQTRDLFRYRELDRIRVIGKQQPVSIYELCGPLSQVPDPLIERFHEALACYRTRDWEQAAARFDALCADFPEDQPSQLYRERCVHFRHHPPAAIWDGVYDRQSK